MRPSPSALRRAVTIGSWPTRLEKFCGRHLRARTWYVMVGWQWSTKGSGESAALDRTPYRCSLPGLTRFGVDRCTGPEPFAGHCRPIMLRPGVGEVKNAILGTVSGGRRIPGILAPARRYLLRLGRFRVRYASARRACLGETGRSGLDDGSPRRGEASRR